MSALNDGLQAALAAEHRAVFGYALLGPRLDGADRQRAQADYAAHESVRDETESGLAAAGVTPVGPEADYPDLFPVSDAAAARTTARGLEDATAAAWREVYTLAAQARGARAGSVRAEAQRRLTAAAVRSVRWRAAIDPARATTPFPGI